jgi:hypothetical protein
MTIRHAARSCGQLRVACEGELVRLSMCHCLDCQRRTGSIFGVQARWPRGQVKIEGKATKFVRAGDTGNKISFYFCPACGTTLYWVLDEQSNIVAVAVGAFADPTFPPPKVSVYESRRHPWSILTEGVQVEHLD